ncbi:MAG: hypothetical protein EA425_00440 [Puniceicoccaceae bacterium]|nr:MAG: hypothetical protein EA425_00440 [Puniceicoccaceae bacterium]
MPEVLKRAMANPGERNKTEAVTTALRGGERRGRLVERLREGLGASAAELRQLFDPASDPALLRVAEAKPSFGNHES